MSPELREVLEQLITANHILHYHGAVDGFGHVSVRHPDRHNVYILCGYMPPAAVEDVGDLIEYYVDGSEPVDPAAKKGYSERYIHGELFKRYPQVNCVVHSHGEAVLPYVVTDVELRPMYHMAGFLGDKVPLWDIVPVYSDDPKHREDMLVNNERLGASLAARFSDGQGYSESLVHNVVLQRSHGFTTWGKNITTAVYHALYTLVNAELQTKAMLLTVAAHDVGLTRRTTVDGLHGRHLRDCQEMEEATQDKSWRLWEREVSRNPMYRNALAEERQKR